MFVLEQALNSAAKAETARIETIAANFILQDQ
jgi:hypothetical protein